MQDSRSARRLQTLVGIGALALAAVLAWGAIGIPSQAGYSGVGPNFLPWVVSAVLALCGVGLLVQARGAGFAEMEAPTGAESGDWRGFAWVAAGLLSVAALIATLGFVLSCTLCFMLAVRGLRQSQGTPAGGLRQGVLDFVTGFLIAAPAFWTFTKALAISLPALTSTGWL
jgi:putative tricarboxylic transport membrane protein